MANLLKTMITEEQRKKLRSNPNFKALSSGYKQEYAPIEENIDDKITARQERAKAMRTQSMIKSGVSLEDKKIEEQKANDPMRKGIIGSTLGAGFDVLKGVAKGVGSTVVGMGELGTKLNPFISKEDKQKTSNFAQGLREDQLKARGTAEQTGKTIEQLAEFFIPASASLKAGKIASGLVSGGLKGATKLGAIGVTEGVLGTGQSAMQSGKLGADEMTAGAISLVAPAGLSVAGKLAKSLTPQPVRLAIQEAIDKAIRPSKKSLSNPKYNEQATEALYVLDRNKTDFGDGLRNPDNRVELLETLKNAKKPIYEQYTTLAENAGVNGANINVQDLQANIINTVKSKGWSNESKQYAYKQAQALSNLEGATPKQIQERIEELNAGFTPMGNSGDRIKTQIDASIATQLRSKLDDAIENVEGEGWDALRKEYRALKTIQNDVENAAAVEARRNNKGLIDFTDIFTGGNITGAVFTGNPAMLAQGLAGRGIKEYIKWLNDPNRYLKNAFKAIEKNPIGRESFSGPTRKLLEEGKTVGTNVNVPISLPAKAPSTVAKEELDLAIKSMDKRQLFEALNRLDEQDLRLMLTEGTGGFQGTPIELPAKGMSTSNKIEYPRK